MEGGMHFRVRRRDRAAAFACATRGMVVTREPEPISTFEVRLDLATVYFDFDRAAIRPDQRDAWRPNAEALRAVLRDAPDAQVVLEGRCDERGDEEHNLALGKRRAESVRRFLANPGLP